MFCLEIEGQMAGGRGAGINGGTAGDLAPKAGNFFEVGGPVLDVGGENGAQNAVLADVRVKVAQEDLESRGATQAVE